MKAGSRDKSITQPAAQMRQDRVSGVTCLSLALQREDFQMYEKYCQNKPRSESLWRQCSESSFFQVSFSFLHVSCSYPGEILLAPGELLLSR